MKKAIYIGIGALLLLGTSVYVWMGGFSSPEISAVKAEPVYLLGKDFEGLLKSDRFRETFQEADSLQKVVPDSRVAALFYNEPEEVEDTISGFIGIIVPDTSGTLPEGFEYRHVPERQVLETVMNYIIVPPDIYNQLDEYAEENQIELGFPVLEVYPGEKKIKIQAPVK